MIPPPSSPGAGPSQQITPGRFAESAVSDDSRCDYTIYTVRTKEVVSGLSETKTTKHPLFKHAIAQVIQVQG